MCTVDVVGVAVEHSPVIGSVVLAMMMPASRQPELPAEPHCAYGCQSSCLGQLADQAGYNTRRSGASSYAWGPWVIAAAILAAHAVLAATLLDETILLQPDATEFVIGARGLATGNGYRDLSDPDMVPLQRPIGMSLLLAPVVRWRGYDVVACKLILLACGIASGWTFFAIARRVLPDWAAVYLLALFAVSPVVLHHHSRLMGEVPLTMLSLILLWLILGDSGKATPIHWTRLAAICLLAFLATKMKTQAVVLWPALLAWASACSDCRRILKFVGVTIGLLLVSQLLPLAGDDPARFYTGYLRDHWAAGSSGGLPLAVMGSLAVYGASLLSLLAPSYWPDLSYYGTCHYYRLPTAAAVLAGVLILVAGAIGLRRWARRTNNTSAALFVAVYVGLSCLMLLLWPHRMSRLAYPLVPFCGLFLASWWNSWPSRCLRCLAAVVVLGTHVGTVAWFFDTKLPPVPGWHDSCVAGAWLHAQTPVHSRVLTSRKSLFLSSGRFQRPLRGFCSLAELNYRLHALGANYLRISTGADDPRLWANPTFRFRPVPIETGEYALWEVMPNDTGTVARVPPVSPLPRTSTELASLRRQPHLVALDLAYPA